VRRDGRNGRRVFPLISCSLWYEHERKRCYVTSFYYVVYFYNLLQPFLKRFPPWMPILGKNDSVPFASLKYLVYLNRKPLEPCECCAAHAQWTLCRLSSFNFLTDNAMIAKDLFFESILYHGSNWFFCPMSRKAVCLLQHWHLYTFIVVQSIPAGGGGGRFNCSDDDYLTVITMREGEEWVYNFSDILNCMLGSSVRNKTRLLDWVVFDQLVPRIPEMKKCTEVPQGWKNIAEGMALPPYNNDYHRVFCPCNYNTVAL